MTHNDADTNTSICLFSGALWSFVTGPCAVRCALLFADDPVVLPSGVAAALGYTGEDDAETTSCAGCLAPPRDDGLLGVASLFTRSTGLTKVLGLWTWLNSRETAVVFVMTHGRCANAEHDDTTIAEPTARAFPVPYWIPLGSRLS